MKIELKEITVREVAQGYTDNKEDGITGYNGKLDIRPAYQREFIYKDKQRDAVVETVLKGFPLNTMYWVKRVDGTFELLEGQQRTISICSYVDGKYSVDYRYFHNLNEDEQNSILDYKLMVYVCEGSEGEKLDWFRTINIAGEKLTDQELRNAAYTGPWLASAKKYFSKSGCPAYNIGSKYIRGSVTRQDYLETAIKWASKGNIEQYMADNQNTPNASKLWLYFNSVITWVTTTFPTYRKEMKGLSWGELYDANHNNFYDSAEIEKEVLRLMMNEDVTKKAGIYSYILTGMDKFLNIRSFSPRQKREAFERQAGVCVKCEKTFEIDEMEADHITPWHEGGQTSSSNCQMLCKRDNRTKSGK